MSNAAFHFVPVEDVGYVWDGVKPLIDKTQNRPDDCLKTEDFHQLIIQGSFRLVIGLDLAFSNDFYHNGYQWTCHL